MLQSLKKVGEDSEREMCSIKGGQALLSSKALSIAWEISSQSNNLSFEQLGKKKQAGVTSVSAQPKSNAMSSKNTPAKPPIQAPKTNVQDLKKFVQSDKKPEAAKKEKHIEAKPIPLQTKSVPEHKVKEKEKPVLHEAKHDVHKKMGHKDIDEH